MLFLLSHFFYFLYFVHFLNESVGCLINLHSFFIFSNKCKAANLLPSTALVTPHIAFINENRAIKTEVDEYDFLKVLPFL